MKKVRLLLGIGAFAAGALALYYFAKKKESAKRGHETRKKKVKA